MLHSLNLDCASTTLSTSTLALYLSLNSVVTVSNIPRPISKNKEKTATHHLRSRPPNTRTLFRPRSERESKGWGFGENRVFKWEFDVFRFLFSKKLEKIGVFSKKFLVLIAHLVRIVSLPIYCVLSPPIMAGKPSSPPINRWNCCVFIVFALSGIYWTCLAFFQFGWENDFRFVWLPLCYRVLTCE